MALLKSWCNGTQEKAKKTCRTYTEKSGSRAKVLARLGKIVRSHYDQAGCIADDIARLGYAGDAAAIQACVAATSGGGAMRWDDDRTITMLRPDAVTIDDIS